MDHQPGSQSRWDDPLASGLTHVLPFRRHRSVICYGPFWSLETPETVVDLYLGQAHTGYKA